MYDIALSVQSCLRAGTKVDVAWVVDGTDVDATEAVAITPGGGKMGSLMGGALDHLLTATAEDVEDQGVLIVLDVGPTESLLTGLDEGTSVTIAVVAGSAFPEGAWDRLAAREPTAFGFTRTDADLSLGVMVEPKGNRVALTGDTLITSVSPQSQALMTGGGPIADALVESFALIGWKSSIVPEVSSATGVMATLSAKDAVVVIGHDLELAGPALQAAIQSNVGYIGSVGSPDMQELRRQWLSYRDIDWDNRVHGPAGLSIGASNPQEIAISIVAEVVATVGST